MKAKLFLVLFLFSLSTLSFASVFKSNATASYYAEKYHGRKTANGEVFNMYAMTCAHKTLPFGTVLRVTNLNNNKTVDVRVNDRGPFVKGRELDVSKAAAQKLGMIKTGTAKVRIEILGTNNTGEKTLAKTVVSTPAVIKTSAPKTYFWDIQVGSFSSHENANRIAQQLIKYGFENVYFQKTEEVTRVVLKKIPDDSLQVVEAKLKSNGYSDFVVKKNS